MSAEGESVGTSELLAIGDRVQVRDCRTMQRLGLPNPNPGVVVACTLGRPDDGVCIAFDNDPGDPKTPVHFDAESSAFPLSCVEKVEEPDA